MSEPYIEYDYDPRNLPNEYLAAIGLAVTAASQTNKVLSDAIAGCAGIDVEYGAAITTHMGVPLRIGALRCVAACRIPDDLDGLDELDVLAESVRTALEKRNSQAHDVWCRNPVTGQVYRVQEDARTHYELALEPTTIDEIKGEAALVYEAGMALQRFLIRKGLVPKLPQVRKRGHNTPEMRKKRRKAMGK